MTPLSTLITDEAYRDHAAFWTSVLDTIGDDFHFRQPWLSYAEDRGGVFSEALTLPEETAQRIRGIGRGDDLGAFVVLVSAVSYLLHVCTGARVVAIDSPPLARRPEEDAEDGDEATGGPIPLIAIVDGATSIREHLAHTSAAIAKSYTYQHFPIAEACDALLGKPRPLTNVLACFDGLHDTGARLDDYDLRLTIAGDGELRIRIEGRAPSFSQEYLRTFARHLGNVVDAYGDLSRPLNDIDVMGAEERRRVLVDYNKTGDSPVTDQTIHDLFQEQAGRTPDHEAVRTVDRAVTYDWLNRTSNRLARFLRTDLGVRAGDVVGVVSHRSELAIAGLLGVLKAGAVYLPIDPEYPEDRLRFMVEDAAVKALLVHSEHFPQLGALYETPMFALDLQLATLDVPDGNIDDVDTVDDVDDINDVNDVNSRGSRQAGDPAYIIYTSGSTGQPKAVVLEHRGFVNMVRHHIGAFGIGPSDRLLQFYGHSFDSSLFEIFVSLLSGATIVMVDRDTINDPEQLSAYVEAQQVTTLTLPPIYQGALDRGRLSSVRSIISAGDHCKVADALAFARTIRYYNSYGPTETSVCVTHYQVDPGRSYGSRMPIGTPISHTSIFLLDDRLRPVPEGVVGEICVGGISLARGYLNRDDLTGEKFVHPPFAPGERLYRTGDLGVWLPDGNLELIGRKDHQVKIRGYRIELGEIESVLAQHARVREAVTLAVEDETGNKRLVAYVTGSADLDVAELKTLLRSRLPEFMIPSAFVVLETMPLTPNGKIDRKALPSRASASGSDDPAGREPRNETEAVLLRIWSDVLGLERIGIHDNLFALGGDSILVIQIVTRARHAGLRLTPNQLFEHQTIAALSQVAAPAEAGVTPLVEDEVDVLDGPVTLAPMQEWFFSRGFADPHHFNQSVMFEVPADFQPAAAGRAVRALLDQHDALRLTFARSTENGQWTGAYGAITPETPFSVVDLSPLAEGQRETPLRDAASLHQTRFDLSTGPLIRVVLFQTGPHTPSRLLFVVHHLVVDGVSWRVLLEDFRAAYGQLSRGDAVEMVTLPAKTTSYGKWAALLREHASIASDERAYWLSPERGLVEPLPTDFAFTGNANTVASTGDVSCVLDSAATLALLHEAPRAYSTDINDLLLTALARTLAGWIGRDAVLVDVEGHGREDLLDRVDTSRTVGWLTSQFPLFITVDRHAPLGDALKSVKEQLRAVPRRGAGFGMLRYLARDAALAEMPQPGVLFNYMGQSGRATDDELPWTPLLGAAGREISPRAVRSHLVEINGIVLDGRLELVWTFSEAAHRRATIEGLAARYEETLRALVDHCRNVATTQYTPSDFPAARLDQKSLDALIAKISNS